MSNKDKKDKKKRDKKRRERRQRKKGPAATAIDSVVGYLTRSETTMSLQGNKPKERAGVDAYDTLHSIIKSQQMQSASYITNLERMAFKTEFKSEIGEQLKKQGRENLQALEETKKAVDTAVEKVGRRKRTEEEKIAERQSQIAWQMRRGELGDKDLIAQYEKDIRKYQSVVEMKQSFMAPAIGQSPITGFTPQAGGGQGGASFAVAPAPSTTQMLSSKDPLQNLAVGGGAAAKKPSNTDVVSGALQHFQNPKDNPSTSGTPSAAAKERQRKK